MPIELQPLVACVHPTHHSKLSPLQTLCVSANARRDQQQIMEQDVPKDAADWNASMLVPGEQRT